MSIGEVRNEIDGAILLINDQLNVMAEMLDVVSPLPGRVGEAVRGLRQADAEILVQHLRATVEGLTQALGAGSVAFSTGTRLLAEL